MQSPKSNVVWREGDEELHNKVNETIRRHLLWSRRVNWEGVQSKPLKRPLRKSVLPATKFENLQEYGCVICSSELNRSTVSCLYPCLHRFCYGCILKWLKLKQTCPLCLATPEKLFFSIQNSKFYKETDLSCNNSRDLEKSETRYPAVDEFVYAPQESTSVHQQIVLGARRQREFIVEREERVKLTRKSTV
jgi:hypothetical protein